MEAADKKVVKPPVLSRHVSPLHLLWLASPMAYPMLYFSTPVIPEMLRLFAGPALFLLLPGWLFHLVVFPQSRIGLASRLTRSIALSVAIGSFLGMLGWFFGGDVGLGPVSGLEAARPILPGRLSTLAWAEAGAVLVMAILLVVRDLRGSLGEASKLAASAEEAKPASPDQTGSDSASSPVGESSEDDGTGEALKATEAQRELFVGGHPANPVMQRILREAYRLGDQHKKDHPVAPRWATLLVLGVLMISASCLGFYAGGQYGLGTDALDHLACLREMVERDQILPRTTFYAEGDGAAVDARKGFFHVLLAAQAFLTHSSTERLWHFLPGLLMPLALIIFHSFSRRLLRSEGTALFATFLAFVFFGEINRGAFLRLGYGSQMGIVLAWATLAVALEYVLRTARRRVLLLVAMASFGATATHIFAAFHVLFSLSVFFVAMLILHGIDYPNLRRVGWAFLAASAGCLIPTVWRFVFAYAPLNPIHTHTHGILSFGNDLFILMPEHWKRFLMGTGFGGIFLSLFLWRHARKDDAILYLAALSLVPILIVANPLVVPLLEPYLGYLVARFVVAVPFLMVFAYMARSMGENLLALNSARRVITSLLFYVFMVVLLFPRLEGFARSYARSNLEARHNSSALAWKDLLDRVNDEIEQPAVILSDPVTGYSIPAFTPHYTVSVLHQHGSPSDSLATERLAACRDVLSPYRGAREKARLCRRFQIEYVLVNGQLPRRIDQFFCNAGGDLPAVQIAALNAEPGLFEKVFDHGRQGESALYRVRRENVDALSGVVRPGAVIPVGRTSEELTREVLVRTLPGSVFPVLSDTLAGITLTAVALDTTLVSRGETVGVTLYWRRVGESPQFPVDVHLRMETAAPRGPLWSLRWSKIHRRWQQGRNNVVYRFPDRHVPLEGMLGIEHWPLDWLVIDRIEMKIPEYAALGEYELKVSWMEQTFLPNWPFTYYLSDHDLYDGETVGVLEVY